MGYSGIITGVLATIPNSSFDVFNLIGTIGILRLIYIYKPWCIWFYQKIIKNTII